MRTIKFRGTEDEIDNLKNLIDYGSNKLPKIIDEGSVFGEIIFTASVISFNSFEDIRCKLRLGSMATHEWIKDFAIKFENTFGHVGEWETYLDENHKDVSDWEEFLIKKVNEQVEKENL